MFNEPRIDTVFKEILDSKQSDVQRGIGGVYGGEREGLESLYCILSVRENIQRGVCAEKRAWVISRRLPS